jgi:ribosomal protein S12 methylthiotransferase accessory factor
MENKTRLPGKDSPLENTIDLIRNSLAQLGIELTETSWLNPVPRCWSVHLQTTDCKALYTNGKGTSTLACLASGLGEFTERLATDFFFSEYFLGIESEEASMQTFHFYPDELWFTAETSSAEIGDYLHTPSQKLLLTTELFHFYNQENELQPEDLFDNNLDTPERGICALPFINTQTLTPCYFPVSLLNNLYVSNGMAAGNSPSECTAQALSEILERYVKNRVISKGLSLPEIPDSYLTAFPHLLAIRNNIEDHGFTVTLHDSSLGGRFPVICVMLTDRKNGGVFAAFGANCRFEIAIERTLTELLQGRNLNQLHNFKPPIHNIDLVAEPYNLESHFIDSDGLLCWTMFKDPPDFPFSPWIFNGSTEDEVNHLKDIIGQQGFDIYQREYLHCGLYTCRIIIPGMSEIYPVDDLIWNNRNKGAGIRPIILQLAKMNTEQLNDFLNVLDQLGQDDQQLLSHLIGIIFDLDSGWDTLRIGELRAHIHLAAGNIEEAGQWCDWVVNYSDLPDKRHRLFRLLATLCNIQSIEDDLCEPGDLALYKEGLLRFYTDLEMKTALPFYRGEQTFMGLKFDKSWTQISCEHQKLLSIYKSLNEAKANFAAKIGNI